MTARFIVADVFDGLATLEDNSVDLVITSPPFLALRSYLPADHPDKGKEIGSESTPAEFIDTLLKVTAELRRVLAPHGSICVELGDTYTGGGAPGWDRLLPLASQTEATTEYRQAIADAGYVGVQGGPNWPLAKSRTLIPSLYQIALAYGFNPLTGSSSPAGQWRIRNVVTWARPNPPVGALGDKWRPATSDLIVACTSSKRYWDDLATRKPADPANKRPSILTRTGIPGRTDQVMNPLAEDGQRIIANSGGAPLLDYWVIPPTGYTGSHYAVFPPELVEPCIKAMCPQRVCVTCGEPSRRIVVGNRPQPEANGAYQAGRLRAGGDFPSGIYTDYEDHGFSDCGHDTWRPGLILDPFAGSGTTLSVATGHGHNAIGIDIDSRNADLARDRVGPFLFDQVDA